jgi:hypothetical protein
MNKTYLELYEEFDNQGFVTSENGICEHCETDPNFDCFRLTDPDFRRLHETGFSTTWWGSDISIRDAVAYPNIYFSDVLGRDWSDTRKNIILFLAAMNGEL